MQIKLKYAGIAGILAFVLFIPIIWMGSLHSMQGEHLKIISVPSFFIIISWFFYVYFALGFAKLGKLSSNNLLRYSSYAIIAFSCISYLSNYLFDPTDWKNILIIAGTVVFLAGIISIPFGIAILRLKDKFGNLATTVGILNIIVGVSFVTLSLSSYTSVYNVYTMRKLTRELLWRMVCKGFLSFKIYRMIYRLFLLN